MISRSRESRGISTEEQNLDLQLTPLLKFEEFSKSPLVSRRSQGALSGGAVLMPETRIRTVLRKPALSGRSSITPPSLPRYLRTRSFKEPISSEPDCIL